MASYASDFNPFMSFQLFHKYLHPEEAYDEAGRREQQGWNEAKGYETPYWQHGMDQYGDLNTARKKLMDPAALQNEWSKNYETSPYAKRMLDVNSQQGQEAAASMGLGGSSAAVSNIQRGAGDIVARDRQQYMNDLMQKYMSGIGLGQGMYNTGANMGATLGGQSMRHGENQAGLGYGASASQGQLFENIMKMIASAYGGHAGGGAQGGM